MLERERERDSVAAAARGIVTSQLSEVRSSMLGVVGDVIQALFIVQDVIFAPT